MCLKLPWGWRFIDVMIVSTLMIIIMVMATTMTITAMTAMFSTIHCDDLHVIPRPLMPLTDVFISDGADAAEG